MINTNKVKSQFLGMPYGTACNRLRKKILFQFLKRLKENVCYQCGNIIETEADLSIEHKLPWLKKDPNLFWDLDNIAFSHMSCNYAAASRPNKIKPLKGMSWCYECEDYRPISEFPEKLKKKNGNLRECTSCNSKMKADWRKKTGKH